MDLSKDNKNDMKDEKVSRNDRFYCFSTHTRPRLDSFIKSPPAAFGKRLSKIDNLKVKLKQMKQ